MSDDLLLCNISIEKLKSGMRYYYNVYGRIGYGEIVEVNAEYYTITIQDDDAGRYQVPQEDCDNEYLIVDVEGLEI